MAKPMTISEQLDESDAWWGVGAQRCLLEELSARCGCVWYVEERPDGHLLRHGDNPEHSRLFRRRPHSKVQITEQLCSLGHDIERCRWGREVVERAHPAAPEPTTDHLVEASE